ncbi:MAG: HNH endonuclease, partial [Anaerolineales bacterium]|nr:HNH endonuclease [Anaerolineales bacterium]
APTQEIKHAVFRRDGGRCQRCGTTKNLQYDHKIPYSRGGETTIDNLQLLCKKCNQRKKDKMIWL